MVNIIQLIQLRTIIGYLGEREQYNWWSSSFFSASSDAFLTPVFSRTQSLARLSGVSRAASRVHDEYIGVGAVYHLFRLPERLEQRIVADMQQNQAQLKVPATREEALAWLQKYAADAPVPMSGPVCIGNIQQLQDEVSWKIAAAYYLYALDKGERTYPYFRDASE